MSFLTSSLRCLVLLATASAGLSGCVHHKYYVSQSADPSQFGRDQHACAQESSHSQFASLGGLAAAGVRVNQPLFRSCMLARGYTTDEVSAKSEPPPGYYLSEFDH